MKNNQIQLIKNVKFFFSSFCGMSYFPNNNSIFYLGTNSVFGSYLLNSLAKSNSSTFFKNIYIVIKSILYSRNYNNHKIYKSGEEYQYNRIIVTWAFKNNFKRNGSFNDIYFKINSKNLKKTLWVVIYMSKENPKKIDNNIVLFKPITKKSINLLYIFNFVLKNFLFIFKNFKYFLTSISNENYFADIFLKGTNKYINSNIKFILMPYEGQPFQNRLIEMVKKKYKKVKTIGYIHSPPKAMPSNFIYKNGCPHQIILNGNDQIYCFTKFLGWKKSNIKLYPSFRFFKSNKKIKNTIFLPYFIRNTKNVIDSLKILHEKNFINIKEFKIKNHPAALQANKNLGMIEKITILINNLKKRNPKNTKNKFLIFIGTSGAIIESLERGANVIHICDTPIFDVYSNKLWPSIKVKKISRNIYIYELKKKGNLIKLGNKKYNINRIESLKA